MSLANPHRDVTADMLLVERLEATALVTLNRPAQRNALSEKLLDALAATLDALREEADLAAVVVTGSPPVFCAGHDLHEMQAARTAPDRGRETFARLFTKCGAVMQSIVSFPRPVIAAVEGMATAAGCQLVASCDLAVAGKGARFATPGVDIGLFCSTPMVALTRNIAPKQAMELLLLGEPVDADTALRYGLVNRVVADGTALEAALALGHKIASKSPLVLKTGKHAFYRQAEMGLAEAYAYTAEVMTGNMLFRDAEEGISAFMDKRKPEWRGE
jgi:enoyl-CoA hydratase/carnithine racemase